MLRRPKRPAWLTASGMLRGLKRPEWLAASAVLLLLVGAAVVLKMPAGVQKAGAITVQVKSARKVGPPPEIQLGDPVTSFQWLITSDDVGNPHDTLEHCLPSRAGVASSADFADHCQWPSIRQTPGNVPPVAQGNQNELSAAAALNNLPNGKYLISVIADGYKIDGSHFTVTGGQTTAVTVTMQPYPLPLGTVRIRVFNDNMPVDATYEVDAEKGLSGFTAHLFDVMAEVSTDYYGNPLCTQYQRSAPDATHPLGQGVFTGGKPVISVQSTGCKSDANGDIVIPNLGPNRYASQVVPPTGSNWVQTTT